MIIKLMLLKKQYLEKAKEFLTMNDISLLRYAALELRFCIEAITYEKLDFFKNHLPLTVKNTWQSDKFFRLLERLEPGSTANSTISIGREDIPGVPATKMISLGVHKTLEIRWLSENYHKLGRYLHAQGKDVESEKLREDLLEIIEKLDEIVNSSITHFYMASRFSLNCAKCGEKIPINDKALYDPSGKRPPLIEIECLNEKCGIINLIQQNNDGKLTLCITPHLVDCECNYQISLKKEDLKMHYRFKCPKCERTYRVEAFGVNLV